MRPLKMLILPHGCTCADVATRSHYCAHMAMTGHLSTSGKRSTNLQAGSQAQTARCQDVYQYLIDAHVQMWQHAHTTVHTWQYCCDRASLT
jgi:hypothetical protein